MHKLINPAKNDPIVTGFKFQNAVHVDFVKQYELWPDNLVQQ